MCLKWNLRIFLAVSVYFLGAVFSAPTATAQRMFGPTVDPLAMPPAGKAVFGFRTTVELAAESSVMYLPVSISIQSQGTVTADRNLIFRFETVPGGQLPPRNGIVVDVPVVLSQGMRQASLVRYLPKWSIGRALSVSVLENGEVLPGYTGQFSGLFRGGALFSSLVPSEFETNFLLVRDPTEVESSVSDALFLGSTGPRLTPDELAVDWRNYQRFDVMAMTLTTLNQVQRLESVFAAVRAWVLQGGTLVVLDSDEFSAVFQLVNFSNLPDTSADLRLRESLRNFLPNQTIAAGVRLGEQATEPVLDTVASEMMIRQVGAGQMVVVKRDSFLSPPQVLALMQRTAGYRVSPMLRRGVDPLLGNRRFFEWMIPGVAQPPVYTFIGLLTVFVILVGPIAYRRTMKLGRGYLMFAIAPFLALVTTVAMFGYGIFADGFGTVARVRQLTWVDGVSGDASERVRGTYFAGIRPGDGLRFAPDAEVFPFQEGTGSSWQESLEIPPSVLGTVELRPDEQRFSSSFLPSRQQRQFITHLPRPGIGFLQLTPAQAKGASPTVTNGFEFELKDVVIRDQDGNSWAIQNLSPGESMLGSPLTATAASKVLGQMYNAFVPRAEVREQENQRTRRRRSIYDVLSTINNQVDRRSSVSNGLFELWLQRQMQTLGELPPSHFVAIADLSRDALAVEGCELSASVRYLFGTLR